MPAIPIIHRSPRRAAALALAVSLALLLLGATAPQAPARARGTACHHSAAGHRQRHHGTCARSGRRSKKNRAGHHARRAVRHGEAGPRPAGRHPSSAVRVKPRVVAGAIPTAALLARKVPAGCEDGGAPVRVEDEVFECEDGSEPRCEAGSSFALSDDGSSLLCSADPPGSSGEAACEDGSSPPCTSEAAPPACSGSARRALASSSPQPCEDVSGEAGCEAGSGTEDQGDPALVCNAPGGEAADSS